MKRKLLTETPACPRERLVIISYIIGLSFALERIGPLAAIVIIIFYLLVLYLLVLPNTPENLFASIYSESLIKTTSQHLLLLVGFDTLIYRKYYDTPPILVGHHGSSLWFVSKWQVPRSCHHSLTPELLDLEEEDGGLDCICLFPPGSSVLNLDPCVIPYIFWVFLYSSL
jgi:hypothetical protein